MPKWLLIISVAASSFSVLAGGLYLLLRPRAGVPLALSPEGEGESEDHHEFASQVHDSGGAGGHGGTGQ